jgi:hypothetical protein
VKNTLIAGITGQTAFLEGAQPAERGNGPKKNSKQKQQFGDPSSVLVTNKIF